MRDPIDGIIAAFERSGEESRVREERERLQTEFQTTDRRAIAAMSDTDLASWNAKFPSDSPQSILAEHEWQRRLTVMQVRATRFGAWLGIVGVVVGAVLGAALTYLATKNTSEKTSSTQSQTIEPARKAVEVQEATNALQVAPLGRSASGPQRP